MQECFGIKKVIFNVPATIILWEDGTKTVVKCSDHDIFDPEKGLAMAIAKKALGNKYNYYDIFEEWIPERPSTKIFEINTGMIGKYTGISVEGERK